MIENWYKLAEDESYSPDFSGKTPEEILEELDDQNKSGDCYETAGRIVTDELIKGSNKDIILVHGIVTGQGPIRGIQYGHAWVEEGDEVIDNSNGRNLRLPKILYYALGNIDPESTFRYTMEEARRKILDNGNWGPWDLQSAL